MRAVHRHPNSNEWYNKQRTSHMIGSYTYYMYEGTHVFPLFNLRHPREFKSTTSRRRTLYYICCSKSGHVNVFLHNVHMLQQDHKTFVPHTRRFPLPFPSLPFPSFPFLSLPHICVMPAVSCVSPFNTHTPALFPCLPACLPVCLFVCLYV